MNINNQIVVLLNNYYYITRMNDTELVVEYKTTGELFSRKFAYTQKFEDIEGIVMYLNDQRAMELELRKKYLEWSINRPMYENEEI